MRIKIDKTHKSTLAFALFSAFWVGLMFAQKILGPGNMTWRAIGIATLAFFIIWIRSDIRDLWRLIKSLRALPSAPKFSSHPRAQLDDCPTDRIVSGRSRLLSDTVR